MRDEYILARRDSVGLHAYEEYVENSKTYVYGIPRPKFVVIFYSKQEALDKIKKLGAGEYHMFSYSGSVNVIETTTVSEIYRKPDGLTTLDSKAWTG